MAAPPVKARPLLSGPVSASPRGCPSPSTPLPREEARKGLYWGSGLEQVPSLWGLDTAPASKVTGDPTPQGHPRPLKGVPCVGLAPDALPGSTETHRRAPLKPSQGVGAPGGARGQSWGSPLGSWAQSRFQLGARGLIWGSWGDGLGLSGLVCWVSPELTPNEAQLVLPGGKEFTPHPKEGSGPVPAPGT